MIRSPEKKPQCSQKKKVHLETKSSLKVNYVIIKKKIPTALSFLLEEFAAQSLHSIQVAAAEFKKPVRGLRQWLICNDHFYRTFSIYQKSAVAL